MDTPFDACRAEVHAAGSSGGSGRELAIEERETLVLSAGSATHRKPPRTQTYAYYHIDCKPFLYSVRKYRFSEGHFGEEGPELTFKSVPRLYLSNVDAPLDENAMQSMLIPLDSDIDPIHRVDSIRILAEHRARFELSQ